MNQYRRRFLVVAGVTVAAASPVAVASRLILEIGYQPVLIGGL